MPALTGSTNKPFSDAAAADVVLAASGDAQAFERVYRDHVAGIHSLARRMLGMERADEATHEIFVRAWQKLPTYRGEAAFGTWLHRVAINVMLARRKAFAIQAARFESRTEALSDLCSPRMTLDLAIDMDAAIEQLPAGAREIFVLHDVEGYKHQEIAMMLEVTVGTSKAQLYRARMLLREYLTR